jgi:hypothetical protein
LTNDKETILAAAQLARRAPEEWAKFLEALTGYTEDRAVECIQAQLDMLPVAQGRAQAAFKLRQLLEDCLETAETILNRAPPSSKRS